MSPRLIKAIIFFVVINAFCTVVWFNKAIYSFLITIDDKIHLYNNNDNQLLSVQHSHEASNKAIIVAYVVVITKCDYQFHIADAASVLKYSIYKHTINSSKYDYQMYAFYHPDANECAQVLQQLGYIIQERNTPVNVNDIRGTLLREAIVKNGCCGEKELIKLEAFTLTDHEIVVLLDLDVLVLKPLDILFDFFLYSNNAIPDPIHLMDNGMTKIPSTINLLYTTDYAMVPPKHKPKPTQGGFVILRPNRTAYEEFIQIVLEGDFRQGQGWGGLVGNFWGAMTFQGLIPYYYQVLHPNHAVELNWCVWNNMCSPSRTKTGECYTDQLNCDDCWNWNITDIALIHYTVCQKPWKCQRFPPNDMRGRLCAEFHHAWFHTRSELEQSWGRSGWGNGDLKKEFFYGFCTRLKSGIGMYLPIEQPYGPSSAA